MKTQILTTPNELIERGKWEKYCEISGTNYYAVNEGIMDLNEEIILTEEQAKEMWL